MGEDEYKVYLDGIVGQLQDHFPDASFMVFNFREGEQQSQIASVLLSQYDMTVMDYPRQYESCPLLPLEMIHHFLIKIKRKLVTYGRLTNVLLMHCERGGWYVLAFMLSGLLLYTKQYYGEQKTLEMVHKHAPKELLHLLSPLNPQPSQLRYLQYISILKDFISIAETEVGSVLSLYSVVGKNADALVHYFGEDPNRCSYEQVTATLLKFIRLLKKAHQENVKQEVLEMKVAAKEVKTEKNGASSSS